MTIDQSEYALKIVKCFGLENCKPVRMPLPTDYVPTLNEGEASAQQRTYYQSIIGSLLYLALCTRPDIAYAVISMLQFSANPSEEHIQCVMVWTLTLCLMDTLDHPYSSMTTNMHSLQYITHYPMPYLPHALSYDLCPMPY